MVNNTGDAKHKRCWEAEARFFGKVVVFGFGDSIDIIGIHV